MEMEMNLVRSRFAKEAAAREALEDKIAQAPASRALIVIMISLLFFFMIIIAIMIIIMIIIIIVFICYVVYLIFQNLNLIIFAPASRRPATRPEARSRADRCDAHGGAAFILFTYLLFVHKLKHVHWFSG